MHIKIDTGMHRLGIHWERLDEIAQVFHYANLRVTGAFTHLCANRLATVQGQRFYQTVARLKEQGCSLPAIHLLASGGLLCHPELGGNRARVGIALYGAAPACQELSPVLSLKARVAQMRELPTGESIGYEPRFTARRPSRIAVLTIGYGDGLPRGLRGNALVHGWKAPIAGMICMDAALVDVTEIPNVFSGDTAVLIGKSGGLEITAMDLAAQAGTIPNEILSHLGPQLERITV